MAEITTTETLEANQGAGWVAALVSVAAAVAAFVLLGGFPTIASVTNVLPFGGWLIRFGLVLAAVGFVFATAAAFSTAMGKTTKKTTTDAPTPQIVASAATPVSLTVLKDLIGVTGTLVAQPAGVGAFIMLVGAILVVGVAFAD